MKRRAANQDWILIGTAFAMTCIIFLDYWFQPDPIPGLYDPAKIMIAMIGASIMLYRGALHSYRLRRSHLNRARRTSPDEGATVQRD